MPNEIPRQISSKHLENIARENNTRLMITFAGVSVEDLSRKKLLLREELENLRIELNEQKPLKDICESCNDKTLDFRKLAYRREIHKLIKQLERINLELERREKSCRRSDLLLLTSFPVFIKYLCVFIVHRLSLK